MHRDSRPPPHDDYHETLHHKPEHRPSKAMAMLNRALKKPNSGNPYPHEHDRICSRYNEED
jgi:hypothetical protein